MPRQPKRLDATRKRRAGRVSEIVAEAQVVLPAHQTRSAAITLRATPEEKAALMRAAGEAGLLLTDYLFALHEGYLKGRRR